jgi:hypothetical protein
MVVLYLGQADVGVVVVTPDQLKDKGRALYGERWQSALARDLGVTDRTMRRWLAGDCAIPARAESEMRAVIADRVGGLIAFDVNPGENSICYSYTGTCFRYDPESGVLTELTRGLASQAEIQLIRLAAEEKLHDQAERTPSCRLHGFMRGTVIIPPGVDLTAPVLDEPFDAEEGRLHR